MPVGTTRVSLSRGVDRLVPGVAITHLPGDPRKTLAGGRYRHGG
jgi:hypothetical protein